VLNAWTRRRVLDAVVELEWRPDGAIEVLTDDYRLIRYPDWALDPTFPAAQVTRSHSGRPLPEVIEEVTGRVRRWGLPGVAWWVSGTTRPRDTAAALRDRGAVQIDAVNILVRELVGDLPDLAVPDDVGVELVADARTFRAASMVTVRGWGRAEPAPAAADREFRDAIRDLAAWSSFRVVASVPLPAGPLPAGPLPAGGPPLAWLLPEGPLPGGGGQPVSTGGCTLRGEIAHLWGAVTLREHRRRGCYRAVLAERLQLARAHGATLALVKGRAETSGPILLRAGFADCDTERCFWLSI
jgi:GNAT superfamily N-acetyltransferase